MHNCRDGSAVPLDGLRVSRARLGDLTILAVELSDEGNYTCRASNVYAEIETVSRVEVIKKSGGGEGARDVESVTWSSFRKYRSGRTVNNLMQ